MCPHKVLAKISHDLTITFYDLYVLEFIVHTSHDKLLTVIQIISNDEVLVCYRWQRRKQTVLLIWSFLLLNGENKQYHISDKHFVKQVQNKAYKLDYW